MLSNISPLWLLILLCPLMHIAMMYFMKDGSCHDKQHHDEPSNSKHLDEEDKNQIE